MDQEHSNSIFYILVFKIINAVLNTKDAKNNKALTHNRGQHIMYIIDMIVHFIIQCMLYVSIIAQMMFSVFKKYINEHGTEIIELLYLWNPKLIR